MRCVALVENYDVIVVAGNYRLDSLGWLALEELQNESSTGSSKLRTSGSTLCNEMDPRYSSLWR